MQSSVAIQLYLIFISSAKRRVGPCRFDERFICGYITTAVTTDAAVWARATDRAFFDASEDVQPGLSRIFVRHFTASKWNRNKSIEYISIHGWYRNVYIDLISVML